MPLKEPKQTGDFLFYINEDSDLLLTLYKDRSQVKILSNIGLPRVIKVNKKVKGEIKEILKPEIICNYNIYSKGVDFCNQKSTSFRFPHGSRKWWRPVYFHILHIAISNSFIIFNQLSKSNSKMSCKSFTIRLSKTSWDTRRKLGKVK